jgi:sugar phosphate isomerase/epimerase
VQAEMLKDLGYAGIGYTGTQGIPEMLDALDRQGLKMFSIYVGVNIGTDPPAYDPHLQQAVRALKGRDTVIWLTVTGRPPDGKSDDRAVAAVRHVADLAEEAGLRVALYPHVGFYVARVEDSVRVAERADRRNVGASFNLCHWLKLDDEKNMVPLINKAMPYLFMVSINGADREGDWDRLIQTLDRGEFDVFNFLKTLKELGYTGPIGLQCYNIRGDIRQNLKRSMDAWQGLCARMAAKGK